MLRLELVALLALIVVDVEAAEAVLVVAQVVVSVFSRWLLRC